MSLFLAELSKEFNDDIITIIMDGAGWHKAHSLSIPENIQIIYLPPYSPELNPIERLWLYIKKSIMRNKIYETMDDLEQAVSEFLCLITNSTIAQICATDYMTS